ncbi:Frizzled-10 [Chamberlinius hualienensis]
MTGKSDLYALLTLVLLLEAATSAYGVGAGLYGGSIGESRRSRCERITIPLCRDMPYNMTRMPNLMENSKQAEAGIRIHEYKPLIEYGCSKHLKFFLCSLFAPMCTEQVDVPIPSCRALCEEVRDSCLPVMQRFSFPWPAMLNCSRFPVPEKNGLCMQFPNITEEYESDNSVPPQLPRSPNFNQISTFNGHSVTPQPSKTSNSVQIVCPIKFVIVETKDGPTCVPKCEEEVYFKAADKEFAEIWMALWAIISFLATAFTVLTFLIDSKRFKYPERPVIYLSICCMLYSLAYLIRLMAGRVAVSCDETSNNISHLIIGLENFRCVLVFVLLYYFGMAACVWWVILSLTWFLSAGKKWGHEAVEAWNTQFHFVAWGLPSVQTIVVLTMRKVDGDELTGLCYPGNQDLNSLTFAVIVPLCVYSVFGVFFYISGFAALFRIRGIMKREGRDIVKLQKLIVRIGVFLGLYTVPEVCVLICYLYEHWNFRKWRAVAMLSSLDCQIGGLNASNAKCQLKESIPSVEVFLFKTFMALAIGITCGLWVWSNKTWISWERFIYRHFRRNNSKLVKSTEYSQVPVTILAPLKTSKTSSTLPLSANTASQQSNIHLFGEAVRATEAQRHHKQYYKPSSTSKHSIINQQLHSSSGQLTASALLQQQHLLLNKGSRKSSAVSMSHLVSKV